MAFSGGFSVHLNNMRTSSVRWFASHRLKGSWLKDLRHLLMAAPGYGRAHIPSEPNVRLGPPCGAGWDRPLGRLLTSALAAVEAAEGTERSEADVLG